MAEEFTGKDAVHLISNIYSANNFWNRQKVQRHLR
jgi:hypothetical protein